MIDLALAAVPPSLLIHGSGRREDVPIRSSGFADVDGQKEVRVAAAARGATYRVTHLVTGPTFCRPQLRNSICRGSCLNNKVQPMTAYKQKCVPHHVGHPVHEVLVGR